MSNFQFPLAAAEPGTTRGSFAYPQAKKVDQVDEYHGVRVADPYRWLEDSDSPDTRAWIAAQNAIAMPYLAAIPERKAIRDRLQKLVNYERYASLSKAGANYFYERNDGLQERYVLYVTSSLEKPGDVLLDPNQFPDKSVALADFSPSPDGKLLAYSLSRAGSDWREAEFLDVTTRRPLADRLKWLKFTSLTWSEDGKGIYYCRYQEPSREDSSLQEMNLGQQVFYHRLGTPQTADRLVYSRPAEPKWLYGARETEDGRYVLIGVGRGQDRNTALFYRAVGDPPEKTIELLNRFDAMHFFAGSEGDIFYVRTNLNSPRGRVVAIDLKRPQPENWTEIIPEAPEMLSEVEYTGGRFFAQYLKDARSEVRQYDRAGKLLGRVDLPGIGKAEGFTGRRNDRETFYSFTSYTVPLTFYRFDLESGRSTAFRRPSVPADLSPYETKLVFYRSKDGQRVPMFVTHRKDLKLDGSNPVYLSGYGGFNVPVSPGFSSTYLTWLEMGGVLAVPGIRGGGEYGADWHQAGTRTRKQNVFDDFIAAAEWLIANRYTSPAKLAIAGASNGGLLVAACMLQRPDLFGTALPAVGVLDMLRFHKFTIGWAWVSDYGSVDNPDEFKALYTYSPLHNIKPGIKAPPTLITTADHDDRVVPAHSFKFTAALQAAHAGDAPVLIRIQTKAGHGAGKPLSMILDEQADSLAFVVKNLGMKAPANW